MKTIRRNLFLIILLVSCTFSYAQSFEGWIIYKMETLNPNPKLIPDSTWQEGIKSQLGERGYIVQKYYYKKDKYLSEIDAGIQKGYQVYNTKDKLLYSWENGSDTALTVDSRMYMDEVIEFTENEMTETIMGIPCKSLIVKSKYGQMTLWYNPDYFKMDPKLYEGHQYGHWEEILKETGCLPLKMEQKGFMTHIVQTAIEYNEEPVSDALFTIPEFKVIIEDPSN